MVQHFIEEHQRDVKFLLIEDLQTGLHIVSQFLLFHWDVVLHLQIMNLVKLEILKILSILTKAGISMFNLFLIYLGEPVAVEDGPVESLIFINVGEVFESNYVDVFICPPSFFITNQPEKQFKINYIITLLKKKIVDTIEEHTLVDENNLY